MSIDTAELKLLPVIGPLDNLGGSQVNLTSCELSSTGETVRSLGAVPGADGNVVFWTTILHGLSRLPFTTFTVNSYWVFGLRSVIIQFKSVELYCLYFGLVVAEYCTT